jgi:hypothetical protein
MQDPKPENIEGAKQVAHTVNHEINWGYVALGVAAVVIVLVLDAKLNTETAHPKNDTDGVRTEV